MIKPYPKNKNRVMDEFKSYAERVKAGAVIGDSFMYLLATPLLYLYIQKNNINTNTFNPNVCFFLMSVVFRSYLQLQSSQKLEILIKI